MGLPSIAPTLVETAKMKFSEYSWMDFGTVNLDQDAPAKYHGRYDIVIAMNVVHATKDLVASTSAMKYLPKNGGIICLSEITKVINWHNIVFGLLPGWRSFTDGRTFALQSAEEWMKVFKKSDSNPWITPRVPVRRLRLSNSLLDLPKPNKRNSHRVVHYNEFIISTVVYKLVDDTEIHADIYVPKARPAKPMPISKCLGGFKPNTMLIESQL
ncbi:hypothetical protein XANCAGTX0491_002824 [Xanthoria calcicola]